MLARMFHGRGDQVTVLSRRATEAPWRVVKWDPTTGEDWEPEVDGADVVINLAGRSVNCRYTPENRDLILRSRVDSTRAVGRAISRAGRPPKVWLQASTATIYAHRDDRPNDEATGLLGGAEPDAPETWRFSIDVATAWEAALEEAVVPGTRKVALRTAMVMSPDRGGIFDALLWLVRRGLGGTAGDGRQFVSWIHHADFARAICWLIDHDDEEGAVNMTSPGPVRNADLMSMLRRAWGARVGLPATRWMLEIGAIFLQTETELVLKSRYVVPKRLVDAGFTFQFGTWASAATDLCTAWRASPP